MFLLLSVLCYSQILNVDLSPKLYTEGFDPQDPLVIQSESPNLLVVFRTYVGMKITISQMNNMGDEPSTTWTITDKLPYIFIKNFAQIEFHGDDVTSLSFWAVCVPTDIVNRCWVTNIPGESITFSKDSPKEYQLNKKQDTLIMFAIPSRFSIYYNVELQDGNSLSVGSKTITGSAESKTSETGKLLLSITNPGDSNYVSLRGSSQTRGGNEIRQPSMPFKGFIKFNDPPSKGSGFGIFILIVAILVIAGVIVYFVRKNRSNRKTFGYTILSTQSTL
ncbi:hypothetical protein GPJ56_001582 [Histomonas meleagridis]|uniref:uncharacterized protein n=1 Tax=Histomonas meleagridis TaxID=135588 RepID=UPI00355ABC70|nr:hypothetical protein GPJ56_001582 [Histomonas meleagridis]KAH0807088.1 hypothetical protein GO595_000264 [Histomonas meleagridis]